MTTLAKKNRLGRDICITALAACGIMLCVYVLLGVYPFGDGTILLGDLNNQYVPYFSHYKRVFTEGAGFAYSFDKSLGGSLVALFAYYVASPLNLLYLLAPVSHFPVITSLIYLLKTALAASLMMLFLGKKYPGIGTPGIVLSLGYGFCTYCVAYSSNIMWHDVVLLLPLILWGLERLLAGKGAAVYGCSLALAIFANFYIAWMACLFVVIYLVWTLLCTEGAPRGRALKTRLVQFAAASALAAGVNAALLAPTVLDLSVSKGLGNGFVFSWGTVFPFSELIRGFVLGTLGFHDIWYGMAPMLYCGLLALVLLPVYFFSAKISRREKLVSGAVVLFMLASFRVEWLNLVWHGFSAPVDFAARNAFLFCFVSVLLAGGAIARGAVTLRSLAWTGGLLGAAALALMIFTRSIFRLNILLTGVIGLVFLGWLLARKLVKNARAKKALAALAVCVACFELVFNTFGILNQLEKYPYSTYQDFVVTNSATINAIRESDPGIYRLEKNMNRTLNDGMLLGYYGVSHFGSTADNGAVKPLRGLGFANHSSNTYFYGSTAFADAVLGLRYLYSNGERMVPAHYERVSIEAPYTVYQNPYDLGLAFTVEGLDINADGDVDDTVAYQNALYRALSGQADDLLEEVEAGVQTPREIQAGGSITITAPVAGYYYTMMDTDGSYIPYTLNGEKMGTAFSAENYGLLNLGYLAAGQSVELGFELVRESGATFTLGVREMQVYCLERAKLEQLRGDVRNTATVQEMHDGHMVITATAGADGWLFVAIPYADGWRATVGGEEVEIYEYFSGFTVLKLPEGTHTVELDYTAPGAAMGWAVSCVAALAAVGWWGYTVYKRRRRR